VKKFQARTEAARPEEPRAGWVLGVGAVSPSPPARRSGESCKLPSGIWGRAPAAIEFGAISLKI